MFFACTREKGPVEFGQVLCSVGMSSTTNLIEMMKFA